MRAPDSQVKPPRISKIHLRNPFHSRVAISYIKSLRNPNIAGECKSKVTWEAFGIHGSSASPVSDVNAAVYCEWNGSGSLRRMSLRSFFNRA